VAGAGAGADAVGAAEAGGADADGAVVAGADVVDVAGALFEQPTAKEIPISSTKTIVTIFFILTLAS